MKTSTLLEGEVVAQEIISDEVDPIQVYWRDVWGPPGRGYVTITCYGCAWTAYFGAMGDRNIRQFFREAGWDYLLNKLGITPHLYQRKRDHAYLAKIIRVVQASLRTEEAANVSM